MLFDLSSKVVVTIYVCVYIHFRSGRFRTRVLLCLNNSVDCAKHEDVSYIRTLGRYPKPRTQILILVMKFLGGAS